MSSGNRYDVIVVGVGAMGSATCYHLASRGVRVLGLEQFDIPHARGSSHGQSRMIRMAYYEHPDYVPLLRRAYELWDALEKETGRKLLHVTGGLYMGPPSGGLVSGSLQSARHHGLAHRLLDVKTLAYEFPQFQVPDDWQAFYEERAGFLLPERVVATYADAALRRGAELHGHEPVIAWNADAAGVSVGTPGHEYRADHVVFCGGPWSGRLLGDLGVQLLVTRQVMGWVWPRLPELFELGRFPVWAIENPDGSLQYGFPLVEGSPGLKTAHHGPETPVDPDRVMRDPQPGDVETFKPALARFLPEADGPVLAMRVCLYTNSPDHHFIIDRHPNHERVTIACGFSGHGFKFASVVGEVLADLALDRKTKLPAQFLGLKRFRGDGSH
jgi:sarcosine oxidase